MLTLDLCDTGEMCSHDHVHSHQLYSIVSIVMLGVG